MPLFSAAAAPMHTEQAHTLSQTPHTATTTTTTTRTSSLGRLRPHTSGVDRKTARGTTGSCCCCCCSNARSSSKKVRFASLFLTLSLLRCRFYSARPASPSFPVTGCSPLKADRPPLHHHYQKLQYHENKIVVRFWIFEILLAVLPIVTLKLR